MHKEYRIVKDGKAEKIKIEKEIYIGYLHSYRWAQCFTVTHRI